MNEAARVAAQHLGRLADQCRLDAAAGDPARDLTRRGNGQNGPRIAWGRADALDDRPEGDREPSFVHRSRMSMSSLMRPTGGIRQDWRSQRQLP